MHIIFQIIPSSVMNILVAVCMLFTSLMDFGTATATPEVELIKEDKMVVDAAIFAGQGITTDGEYYYTSGSLTALGIAGLSKFDAETMELVARNYDAIPQDYKSTYGSDHIGGISYCNGLIYAAVENEAEDVPLVITYDLETLEAVDTYFLPAEPLPDGIPWLAVDGENGYLYCSQFNEVEELLAFDLETMELSHKVTLSTPLVRIQGGEVYDGIIYLSSDVENSNDDVVYTVDLSTGEVDTLCTRSLPSLAGNEAEGLTVYPMADGSFVHVLDYDKTVGVYIRHYKIVED